MRDRVGLPKVAATAALVGVLAAVIGGVGWPEGEADGASASAALEDWTALAGTIAAPWPSRQSREGSFPDYMAIRGARARDLYGHAMLGYGLLKTGVQRGDSRAVSSGLKGLVYAVDHPRPFHSVVFEKLALAAGYNLARDHASRNPVFTAARERWESRLRAMKPTWLGRARAPYFNQHLVDAVLVIELVRTGLRSGLAGTVSGQPGRALGLAEHLVNSRLPAGLGARTSRGRAGTTTLASDGPLAYHALTLGFYARAVRLLGNRASGRAHALLGRLARASWALAAPDGDVSYFGRSQEQAWTLALTAYGAEVAAAGSGPSWARRHRALSRRTLSRLHAVHAGGPHGLHLTPAFKSDPGAALAAQEDYISGTAYSGLTLAGLGWVGDRIARGGGPAGRLAADSAGASVLDRGPRRLAAVSTGRVWYAVRQVPAGLAAVKVRDSSGRWNDALPHGVAGGPGESAAPRLGGGATPRGRALRVESGARVRLFADLLAPSGDRVGAATLRFAPMRCGVRVTPAARAGERWEYSVLIPARPRPGRISKRVVAAGALRTGYHGAGHIVTGGRRLSPSFGPLVGSRMSVRAPVTFFVGRARC